MTDIETLVRLKYDIITSDILSWNLCESYPLKVHQKWAWRCAEDVEYHATYNMPTYDLILAAKHYRGGSISLEDLDLARSNLRSSGSSDRSAWNAALSAFYAATTINLKTLPYATHFAAQTSDDPNAKWDLYIGWLIEELVAWETTNNQLTQ